MKKETKMLIIGILIGAIVTATIFMVVKPGGSRNVPDFDKMPNFNSENFNKEDFDRSKRPSRNNKTNEDNKTEENVDETQD